MPCPSGFASHRFKTYGTNLPTECCMRCGKRHADAGRENFRLRMSASFPWPIGTEFAFYHDGQVLPGWFITFYTKSRVWFYKPSYDGPHIRARRARIVDFVRSIESGEFMLIQTETETP